MQDNNHILGILGGLGPMSSAYFYEMLIEHTLAARDQDHIDMIISSRATTPDRTEFILGRSDDDPCAVMRSELDKLITCGADVIAIPCNTAHYFYERLVRGVRANVLNMVESTVLLCKAKGIKTIGIMATEGTVKAEIYKRVCDRYGMTCAAPGEEAQHAVTRIIYDQVKAGRPALIEDIDFAAHDLKKQGSEVFILGCTELSVAKKQLSLGGEYIDALEMLAKKAIEACGKTSVGFEEFE